ncbi:Smr/MutS family protein [Isorropodon fossajaponicum endosymbiont JTNG4]|uniref:Smr/MutS family protein n=1 Tax=Isorropodon fossajaponicum symbiont TaxID=883811 RepID=UPI001914F1C5|nr:Smr/MutS family protein [Isorropodon fossajaponicum symbiont]BBB23535.1 Smr/MutS family protein [Isorropodon fossajaponicum endosymbiont JTNG4]
MISESDRALFRSVVESSAPVNKDKITSQEPTKKKAFKAYTYITHSNLSGSDVINYARNGVSPKIIKKMKQGNISHAPALDLHGQTTIEACQSLSEFMHYHQHQQFIHIIHGKGYNSDQDNSILKSQVASFLRQHPDVLAFNSCPPKDGGTGAVFALLKQN